MQEIFSAKLIKLPIKYGNSGSTVMMNLEQASKYGLNENDKISLIRKGDEFVFDLSLSSDLVKANEIWVSEEFFKDYPFLEGDTVVVAFTQHNPVSMKAIRKKMLGEKISDEEIDAIIDDIKNNKLSDLVLAYYTSTSFFYKTDPHELAYTTKATAYTGDMYRFPGIVATKYSIGGVPGNETTMILVPILASLWITMPKSFSKAITSPAATGECVNVLMDISFKKSEIVRITDKIWACLVWNEGLNLAPVNDRIIKVSAPLGMEPYARMISSIMAKNYAMGVTHCLIDIPMGPTAKVASQEDAERVAKHFEEIGNYLGIKMDVEIVESPQPVGKGIGAALQAQEALRILQRHPEKSEELEKKTLFLAAKLLLLCEKAKTMSEAEKIAKKQLDNGEAWKKMSEIIAAQNGANPEIKADEIQLWKYQYAVQAKEKSTIKNIDMKYLNTIVRTLWAPTDYKAGIFLHKKLHDPIKKGETIYTLYSDSLNKMELAKQLLQQKDFYEYTNEKISKK